MTHDPHVSELLPAYAMDVADADDRARVDAHLPVCGDCRRELLDIEATLGELAHAPEQVEPAGSLRGRVMAALDGHPQVEAAPLTTEPVVAQISRARERRRRFSPSAASRWAMAAAACAAVAFGGIALSLNNRVNDLEQDLRAAERPVEESPVQPTAGRTLVGQRVADLPTTGRLESAEAFVATSPRTGEAALVIRNLPQPAANRSWQAWSIDAAGRKRSLDVIDSGSEFLMIELRLTHGNSRVDSVAITVEPRGGSKQPTGVPVAQTSLSA